MADVRVSDWVLRLSRPGAEPEVLDWTGGSLDWDDARASVAGGSIAVAGDLGRLSGGRVTVEHVVDGIPHMLGHYRVTAAPRRLGRSTTLELIDETVIAASARLLAPLGLPRAAHPVTVVRQRLGALGLEVAIDDDDQTLRSPMAWDVGTPELQVATDLLRAIGFTSVRPVDGVLTAARAIDPTTASATFRLTEGDQGTHVLDYSLDSDHLAIPNRLEAVSTGDVPLRALMEDWRDTDWSYAARGWWLTGEPIRSTATTQALLDAELRREWVKRRATASVSIQHLWQTEIRLGAVGQIASDLYPVDLSGRWQVVSQSMPISGTPMVTTTMRRIT